MKFYLRECWFLIAILVMLALKRKLEIPLEEAIWICLSSILLIIHLIKTFKDNFWNNHRLYQVFWVISIISVYSTFYLSEFDHKGLDVGKLIASISLLITALMLHFDDKDPQQASVAYIYLVSLAFFLV